MLKTFSSFNTKDMIYNHKVIDRVDDEDFNFHSHDMYEMIFLKSDNGIALVGTKEYQLFKNTLLIIQPNMMHKILPGKETAYERHAILFDKKTIENIDFYKTDKNPTIVDFSSNFYIIDIFKKLDYYCSSLLKENFTLILENSIIEILCNLTLINSENSRTNLSYMNPVLNSAIEYIEKNFRNQISIEDICSNLYISKCHLHHLFMNILKVSPKKYINTKRLNEARNLIRSGRKPYQIYLECGFSDYGTFYRNYKNHFGQLPSQGYD